MSRNEKSQVAAVGLDIGTSRIVAARQLDREFRYESQLNGFVNIPFSKMTKAALEREKAPHSVEGGEILVYGNESEKFADLLNRDVRRSMTRGVLNPDEPDSLKLIRQLTMLLAGNAQPGQRLCFSIPSPAAGSEEKLTYHEATLRQILSDLGYDVKSINEGLAVVYAELESTNYTGIGISCGGGLCNVCFAYLSVPILSFSVPKAGDFIDAGAASATGERANRVRIFKERSFSINGHYEEKLKHVLSVYYDDMIQSLAAGLRDAFQGARMLPKISRPVPIVLSGGTAMPAGFRDRFEKNLHQADFPVEISEIRVAAEPLTTTAKGALVAALCDL